MSGRLVYMNGSFVSEKDAKISIFDSALMFGDMVFEMTRSFNKKQFKLREHLERLYTGVKILRIPLELFVFLVCKNKQAVKTLVFLIFRWTFFRGPGPGDSLLCGTGGQQPPG